MFIYKTGLEMATANGDRDWNKTRRIILFFSGLAGIFIYLGVTEFFGKVFHPEFLLVFTAMMGVSILQGVEKL